MLFINPGALTSYRDNELNELIKRVNEIEPYGISIVDGYELMFNSDLENKCFTGWDPELSPEDEKNDVKLLRSKRR